MKYKVQVFERRSRSSQTDGSDRAFSASAEIAKALGQGARVILHGQVYARSTTAQLSFAATTGSLGDVRPIENGFTVSLSGTYANISTIQAFTFKTTEEYQSTLDIQAIINDSGQAATQDVDFELWATIIDQ